MNPTDQRDKTPEARQAPDESQGPVAFVLGGGGVRGAVEVGQARALFDAGITPDLVVGTSIGAINGAMIANDPTPAVLDALTEAWFSDLAQKVYGQSAVRQANNLIRNHNHMLSNDPLYRLLGTYLGTGKQFEDLAIPFMTVAASVESACERWFESGHLIPAIVASASVPGLMPPEKLNGEHLYDGGLVASIPLGRAIEEGAKTIYVLQVGRIEEPLKRPTNVVGSMWVSFEIARRHRFARDLQQTPDDVTVHVLPSGGVPEGGQRNATMPTLKGSEGRMELAYDLSAEFLQSPPSAATLNPDGDLSVGNPYGMTVRGGMEQPEP